MVRAAVGKAVSGLLKRRSKAAAGKAATAGATTARVPAARADVGKIPYHMPGGGAGAKAAAMATAARTGAPVTPGGALATKKIEYPIRKTTRTGWYVPSKENEKYFDRAKAALRAIRDEFYEPNDSAISEKTGTQRLYSKKWEGLSDTGKKRFYSKVENILRNPGANRESEDYVLIKKALAEASGTTDTDALEEAALSVLDLIRRRRGSAETVARKSLESRLTAKNIRTEWTPSRGGGGGRRGGGDGGGGPPPPPPEDETVYLDINWSPSGGGKTVPDRGHHAYKLGQIVTCVAHSSSGYRFLDWILDGMAVSYDAVIRITMDSDHTLMARFEKEALPPPPPPPQKEYTLIIDSHPIKNVPVAVSGRGMLVTEASLTLPSGPYDIAVPPAVNSGGKIYRFQRWGTGYTAPRITINLNRDMRIVAVYEEEVPPKQQYNLTIDSEPIKNVPVTIDKKHIGNTPLNAMLFAGSYNTEVPQIVRHNEEVFHFVNWSTGSANHGIRIDLQRETKLLALYEKGGGTLTPEEEKEKVKLARWLLRKMPETNYQELLQIFLSYPNIQRMIGDSNTEAGAKKRDFIVQQFQKLYREYHEASYGAYGFDKKKDATSPFRLRKYKTAIRRQWRGAPGTTVGGVGGGITGAASQVLGGALGLTKIRKQAEPTRLYKDPLLRTAINKGKRLLRRYAATVYKEKMSGKDYKLKRAKDKVDATRKEFEDAVKAAHKHANEKRGEMGLGDIAGADPMALVGKISNVLGSLGEDPKAQVLNKVMETAHAELQQAEKELENALAENDPKKLFEIFDTDFIQQVDKITSGLVREYSRYVRDMSGRLHPEYENFAEIVKGELTGEAGYLANYFSRKANTAFRKYLPHGALGARAVSGALMTSGEAWHQFWSNLWTLFTGPWIIGTIFVLVQFTFIMMWIGYDPWLLFVAPAIGALFTFIINIESAKQPLDWIGHMAGGAIMAQSTIILFYALGLTPELFGSQFTFLIVAGIVFLFVGVFQFYQTGGFRVVFQGAILILLFGYFALGPYSIYWETIKDQVKSPLIIAYRAAENAFTDVYLLATNPTEFYARQQVVNVRPEKPLDYPRAVEITSIDALPASVPNGEEFTVIAVMRNEGDLTASNIQTKASCNQFCDEPKKIPTSGTDFASVLKPKEGDRLVFEELTARGRSGRRRAELQRAVVEINLSYDYSTNSSLFVTIETRDEIRRRQFEGEDVFRPVVAIGKNSPAQLSLNVGPQPLEASTEGRNKKGLLLVSVSNKRDDGTVVLKKDSSINIRFPKTIGNMNKVGNEAVCKGQVACTITDDGQNEILNCKVQPKETEEIEILQYEFNSIYAFVCEFTTVDTALSTTDLITAELPQYIFRLSKKRDVTVTPPLGILITEEEVAAVKTVASDKCPELSQQEVEKYNTYAPIIADAINNEDLDKLVSNPLALMAGLYSVESNWNERAVSPCGAAGMAQFIPGTARSYGMNVPEYPKEWCPDEATTTCKIDDVKVKVSACNACTPDKCDYTNDERFNPNLAILGSVKLIKDNIIACDNDVDQGVSMYSSGKCSGNANYVSEVNAKKLIWRDCFEKITEAGGEELPVTGGQRTETGWVLTSMPAGTTDAEGWINYNFDGFEVRMKLDEVKEPAFLIQTESTPFSYYIKLQNKFEGTWYDMDCVPGPSSDKRAFLNLGVGINYAQCDVEKGDPNSGFLDPRSDFRIDLVQENKAGKTIKVELEKLFDGGSAPQAKNFGEEGYCAWKISQAGLKCEWGEGLCDNDNECGDPDEGADIYANPLGTENKCMASGVGNICCPDGMELQQCVDKFNGLK